MRSLLVVPALALLTAASSAQAQLTPSNASGVSDRFKLITAGHRQSLKSFQADVARQRQADGGTLTPAHEAAFARRRADMDDYYRRAIRNADPRTVDANGMPIGHGPDRR